MGGWGTERKEERKGEDETVPSRTHETRRCRGRRGWLEGRAGRSDPRQLSAGLRLLEWPPLRV